MAELTKIITYINIEMSGDTKHYMVSAKQGDKATRYVVAKLLNNGEEYIIPDDAITTVNIEKPDGKHVYNTCTHLGSEVTIELTNQALAAAGTAYCDIEIKKSDNTQLITCATFAIEIERSMRNDTAIVSTNEFTEIDRQIAGHIKSIEETESIIKDAEKLRNESEVNRQTAEDKRDEGEKERQQNELIRQQQENKRQQDTAQVIKNAEDTTKLTDKIMKDCTGITERAEKALQNQEQLEATLNTTTQIQQEVLQIQSTVEMAKKQVEQDKEEIDNTIQNSLLAESEKILESVKTYFERAEALYSSIYLECDGETPYLRSVTPITIDGATPQIRSKNEGVEFDGGTPMSRILVA